MRIHPLLALLLLVAVACSSGPSTQPTETLSLPTAVPPATTSTTAPATASTPAGQGSWEPVTRMIVGRSEVPAVALDGRIYVPGGFSGRGGLAGVESTVEVYDPTTDTWEFVAEMPEARHHLMAAAHSRRLYVFGGYSSSGFDPTDTAWEYDPAADDWAEIARLPFPMGAATAVTLGDFIYLIGGIPVGTTLLRYDPTQDVWTELAAMNETREHVAAAVFENSIYVVAGRFPGIGERSSSEVYDPSTDTWRPLPNMATSRGGHAAAAFQGRIFAIGGEVLSTRSSLDSVEAYDPASETWTPWTPLPVGLHGVPAVVSRDVLYVVGGSSQGAGIENDGTVYAWIPSGG